MRLIDADALIAETKRYVYQSDMTTTVAIGIAETWLKNAPTVEAVPLKPLARFLAEYAAAPFLKLTDLADREIHVKRWEEFLRGIDWSADDDL